MFPSISPNTEKSAVQLLVDSDLLLKKQAQKSLVESCSAQHMQSDGSNRRFIRIYHEGESICILVIPAGSERYDLAEAESAWCIGNHLYDCKVPVPKLFGWDGQTGILLFEDLGDIRLHDFIAHKKDDGLQSDRVENIYQRVICQLANMQIKGAVGFEEKWCWDSSEYDLKLMIERESGYFLRAFWNGLLGEEIVPDVVQELEEIARLAATAQSGFFLHRDFQCRNIMIKQGDVRFIDFQGGRKGPLGYDLASLLIDPYAALPLEMQGKMIDYYLSCIDGQMPIDRESFYKEYNLLAFQRNMQIIGAFSFLYKERGKIFFADYIRPALHSLASRLQNSQFAEYHGVKKMVGRSISRFGK